MEQQPIMQALSLLIVGMLTVFAILLIVIFLGKALIAIINKIAPAEEPKKNLKTVTSSVDALHKSIIEAAVSQITAGKGKVTKISKL